MKKTNFLGDVLKLVSGTAVAQLFTVICAPLLTRLYSPDEFGILNIFISLISVVAAVSCLRYEMAIVLPEKDQDAVSLFWGSLGISGAVSVLMIPIIIFGKNFILQIINAQKLLPYIWLVPISIFFGGLLYGHPSLNYWATRKKHFGVLAISKMVATLVALVLQIGLGVIGFNTGASLIYSTFIGGSLSAVVLGFQLWRTDYLISIRNFNINEILQGLRRYRKFPLYDSWAALINNLSWLLPSFLLARYFSLTEVGLYGLAWRILSLPTALIGLAIAQVFFQHAASAKAEGSLAAVVESAVRSLFALGTFPILLLAMIAPSLFKVFFGQNWAEAGIYIQILSGWTLIWFISSPLTLLYSVLEKQDFYLIFNVIILVARFLALVIGGMLGSARLALGFFAISGILTYGFQILKITSDSGVHVSKIFRIMFVYLLKFLPACLIMITAQILHANDWLQISLACLMLMIYIYFEARNTPSFRDLFLRLRLAD